MPLFFATPPVIIYSPGLSCPSLAASAPTFEATDMFSPWIISETALFCATSDTTSDSAKTVHMLEITMFSFHSSPMVLISSSESPSVLAIISRKRPVPAAHLSFIRKFFTAPFSSILIAFISCPPMSITVRTLGFR